MKNQVAKNANRPAKAEIKRNPLAQPAMNLKDISADELLSQFRRLVQTERKITHLILNYIAEIDARRLFLKKAYPSLYEFLIKEFGYSPTAAIRRIESARLLREVPEVSVKIESGALNLSQLSKVQQALRTVQKTEGRQVDAHEKRALLSKIENTSYERTELILAQELSLPITVIEKKTLHRDESVTLTITLTREQMALLKQAQDLISHSVPSRRWSEAITYLAQKEVARRLKIRNLLPPNRW